MKELQILEAMLNKANHNGGFNLGESMNMGAALNNLKITLDQLTNENENLNARLKEHEYREGMNKVSKAEPMLIPGNSLAESRPKDPFKAK